jgi:hypothetical protein
VNYYYHPDARQEALAAVAHYGGISEALGWYSFASGVGGFWYNTNFAWNGRVRAELYIDLKDRTKNKETFDFLLAQKEDIEREFGEPLEWERQDEKTASRISVSREGSIDDSDERLAEIRIWCREHLLRFKRVFGPGLTAMDF